MSDYLNNLLSRSFKPSTEIQPLAAALFAPAMNVPGRFALAAEQFEDPFTQPSADGQLAENADQLAPRRVRAPLSGEQTVSPIMGDQQRALVTETQPPQRARPNAVAITPSAKFVIEQAPLATVPVTEDLRRFSGSETQAPGAVRPQAKVITPSAESVIQSLAPAARLPKTVQLLQAEALKPDQIPVVHEAKPSFGETLPRLSARRVQPPATQTLVPLGAAAQSRSAQREGAITSDRNSSSPLKQSSPATHSDLPAPQSRVETVIIERVSDIADKTEAVTDARRTLIPKSITAPPLVPNFNKRSKPQSVPIVQDQDTSPPETVINVTIGRIEVRATPPPAPKPERQRGTSSVMGLDEYLRQRNGNSGGPGGRR